MSRRVWLVRHASTDWTGQRWCGTTDLPLNEQGLAEAEQLATRLRRASRAVPSSSARRCDARDRDG